MMDALILMGFGSLVLLPGVLIALAVSGRKTTHLAERNAQQAATIAGLQRRLDRLSDAESVHIVSRRLFDGMDGQGCDRN